MRKAPMYWAMRFATFVQLAMTMSTVVNVVSRMSGMEMPSTPMLKSAWIEGIQAVCSTNCMSAVRELNPVQSGILAKNAAMEMHRESHLAALSRLPKLTTTNPPTMGTEIRIASK
jgi:hypothetical protein